MFGTIVRFALAAGAVWVLWKLGTALLGSFARPVPEAPPAGEMRRVKLRYKCSLCGMEIRIDRATTELPDAPRHCMDEMELVPTPDL